MTGHCDHCSDECRTQLRRENHTGCTGHWVAHWTGGHCPMCAAAPTQGVLL